MVQLFSNHFLDYLLSDPVDKQRHLAGNFRGVSGRLCWIFKFCLRFFLVSAGVSFQSGNLLLRTGRNFDFGIFVLNIYFCVSCVFVLILILSRFNNFPFLFQQFRLGCRSVWRDC